MFHQLAAHVTVPTLAHVVVAVVVVVVSVVIASTVTQTRALCSSYASRPMVARSGRRIHCCGILASPVRVHRPTRLMEKGAESNVGKRPQPRHHRKPSITFQVPPRLPRSALDHVSVWCSYNPRQLHDRTTRYLISQPQQSTSTRNVATCVANSLWGSRDSSSLRLLTSIYKATAPVINVSGRGSKVYHLVPLNRCYLYAFYSIVEAIKSTSQSHQSKL